MVGLLRRVQPRGALGAAQGGARAVLPRPDGAHAAAARYLLYGCVVHTGRLAGEGHYYTYGRQSSEVLSQTKDITWATSDADLAQALRGIDEGLMSIEGETTGTDSTPGCAKHSGGASE